MGREFNKRSMAMNEEILQNINHRIDDAMEYGRQVIEDDQVVEQIEQIRSRSENYIRQHPIKSVAIGFISGYLIGKLFKGD